MARKGRKSYKNFQLLRTAAFHNLGALASDDVSASQLGPTLNEDYFCTSIDLNWSMVGLAGEGPIEFGVAHADYSATEIEECLEVSVSAPNNLIEKERANRLVRVIGIFDQTTVPERINDGRPIKTKLNWRCEGDADGIGPLVVWTRSRFSGTLTGATILKWAGQLNGFWL